MSNIKFKTCSECKKDNGCNKTKGFSVCREWFYRKYAIESIPTRIMAKEIGCVNETINALAKRFGIPVRPRMKRTVPYTTLDLDINEIIRMYVEEEVSCANIGKIFGCTHKPIAERLVAAGIELRHHNDTKRGRPAKNKIYLNSDEVVSLYLTMYESGQTVADKFGVSRQVIDRILKENSIPKKPMDETCNRKKENHHLWRHDLTEEEREKRRDLAKHEVWREEVYKRDLYACQKCADDRGGNLNAHHIIPHSKDKSVAWDIENGITLCKPCHIEFHKKYSYTNCDADDLSEFLEEETAT